MTQAQASPTQSALDNIQANLLRATKFTPAAGTPYTRDWSLFFFFRVMKEAEVAETLTRLAALTTPALDGDKWRTVWRDLAQPSLLNAGLVDQALADSQDAAPPAASGGEAPAPTVAPDGPAQGFLDWLKVIACGQGADFLGRLKIFVDLYALALRENPKAAAIEPAPPGAERKTFDVGRIPRLISGIFRRSDQVALGGVLDILAGYLSTPDNYLNFLHLFDETPELAGKAALEGSLPTVALYEILRQAAPAFAEATATPRPVVRPEVPSKVAGGAKRYDTTPINFAFTFAGLQALGLDATTLASFPDVFKQGMAARSARLQDTGQSAPEYWEGELGLPSVDGYFTGGFVAGQVDEAAWRQLRADIAAFNDPAGKRGDFLRFWLGLLFRFVGLEIVHIELGQDPYLVKDGKTERLADRQEHFGFRDGLSQPFVDMGLADPLPGGGTPARNNTWAPVAPGEIFLDLPDEDGEVQQTPISPGLRSGSTFIVFRKLEQDVPGFRAFLSQQRPAPDAQEALAAQFVGRWKNGAPLVLSPDAARDLPPIQLNDFRYAADDPYGQKCPLGAHIRRANPRDLGGRNDVRRHRILRRSISYGGPLLPDGSPGDGEKRGLLFIAASSRIDLQFEVIQADWINQGELLGQVGLDRCPLIGANDGGVGDRFLEVGAAAPVTGLPRFVFTRGGDYFFAPGVAALQTIARGEGQFKVRDSDVPYNGFSMGDSATPGLLDATRLAGYAASSLMGAPPVVHVTVPPPTGGRAPGPAPDTIAFVAQHADVHRVLSDERNAAGELEFSVLRYHQTGQRITRGYDLIIGTDTVGPTAPTRQRLKAVLEAGWKTLAGAIDVPRRIVEISRANLDLALRRTARTRRIDVVDDLATQASYGLLTQLYGTPGPQWLTELAVALPFASQHITDLPPDWVAALQGQQPDDPGLRTVQIWTALILTDLLGNLQSEQELWPFSRQAASELLNYVDTLIAAAKSNPPARPLTLLDAIVANEKDFLSQDGGRIRGKYHTADLYYRDVSVILLDLMGTTMVTIPMTFGSVIQSLFNMRIDLARLLPVLKGAPPPPPGAPAPLARLIYEAERLNPNLPILMRHCASDTTLPSGAKIAAGEWVAAMTAAADKDPRAFTDPFRFSLGLSASDPPRLTKDYLLFGAVGSDRACWGRERVAMIVLEECVKAAGRLAGLRAVAGPSGAPQTILGVTVGLSARFTEVD